MTVVPAFTHHIGIDYSGAETPIASLKGLRVYMAEGDVRRAVAERQGLVTSVLT